GGNREGADAGVGGDERCEVGVDGERAGDRVDAEQDPREVGAAERDARRQASRRVATGGARDRGAVSRSCRVRGGWGRSRVRLLRIWILRRTAARRPIGDGGATSPC